MSLLSRIFARFYPGRRPPATAAAPPPPPPLAYSPADAATWSLPPAPVISSNLATVAYDVDQARLRIGFRESGSYDYYGVPYDVYAALMLAPSKGIFFHKHIRRRFLWKKVG